MLKCKYSMCLKVVKTFVGARECSNYCFPMCSCIKFYLVQPNGFNQLNTKLEAFVTSTAKWGFNCIWSWNFVHFISALGSSSFASYSHERANWYSPVFNYNYNYIRAFSFLFSLSLSLSLSEVNCSLCSLRGKRSYTYVHMYVCVQWRPQTYVQ